MLYDVLNVVVVFVSEIWLSFATLQWCTKGNENHNRFDKNNLDQFLNLNKKLNNKLKLYQRQQHRPTTELEQKNRIRS